MENLKIADEIKLSGISRRKFLKMMSAAGLGTMALGAGGCSSSNANGKIVIIGGGAAGISMAARLKRLLANPNITIIDPSDLHYYQPGFTLIASGVYSPDEVYKKQSDCMPSGVNWVKDSVVGVDADKNKVMTLKNGVIDYDFLVLAPGLQINWSGVEGITRETLGQGDAYCIYDHQGAIRTWQGMQKFVEKGGRGIYTDTYTKHKCGGAPKKVCLLSEHLARKKGTRKNLKLDFFTASKVLYDVPYFTPRLLEIYKERDVSISTRVRVKGVDTSAKKVHMEKIVVSSEKQKDASGAEKVVEKRTYVPFVEDYDFLHFLPPMTAPDFVKQSGLSWTEGKLAPEGWAATNKETLVHNKYKNIMVVGDVAGIPTSKTSAAIRKQTPVAAKNLVSIMEGKEPAEKYNGYAACPIVTEYGKLIMCEFDYDKKEQISFPLNLWDMSKEQAVGWYLKVYMLKPLYFYGMLNGLV